DSNYYILTTPYAYNYYTGARYNLVNAIKNTVSKKNIILHNNSSEKITAINHQNGRDIWIIGHEFGSNKFFINLLTKDGINECGSIQGIGTSLGNDELNNQGQIKTSSDGSYLAICHNTGMKVEVYYFNNRNGQLQLAKTINTTSFSSGILPYSLDFSSNSQFLYIFLRDSHILQYNLLKDTIVSLIKLSSGSWGQSSRTSNGKIVFHKMDSSNLCAIKFENTDT